ncbi:uncharacterized protein LOC110973600 [Acanthaster planci]|uniref:Uncharacterized protein LOC110973600 n=1 Tax=Acanthaster planci TaxID=133434 RepID=A0A8B7XJS4_ACAPL|nr:uncharacterized protein LOC110973600 [Acanthaster planci]
MDDESGKDGSVPLSGALYHEVAPQKVLVTKAFVGLTAFMIVLSVIFCFIRGHVDFTYYLMAINILISAIIILFSCFWYKTGDLDPTKWWFLILVGTVVIFQCITTDIYVFQHENPNSTAPTVAPPLTTPNSGGPQTFQPASTVKSLLEALGGSGQPD